MKQMLNYKNKVLWALLLVVIVSGLGIYGNRLFFDRTKGKSVTRVSFNFDGVDEGLNPQGGVFDAQVIKSTEVLKGALDQLGWSPDKVDTKALASHMTIKGVVPTDVMSRIIPSMTAKENMQMERVGGLTYHPTQYQVTLSLSRDMKLSTKEANLLLDAIIESYSNYFVTRYKDTQAIDTAVAQIDPERYDYSEYIDLVAGQLKVIKSYLQSKEQASKDFKSSVNGLSFGDLIAQVEFLEDVEVANVQALLDSFVITKNSKESAVVYDNMIGRMRRENEKYKQQAQILKNVANSYKKDKQVVLGSGTLVNQFIQKEEDEEPLYDTLVKDASIAEAKANRLGRQVEYYEALLTNLQAQNANGVSENIQPYIDEVEQSIVYISDQMGITVENIKGTVDDYYEQEVFEGSIIPVMKARYWGSLRLNLIKDTIVLGGITFVMILIGLIYLLGKKSAKERL